MEKVIIINKPPSITPLQLIHDFKSKNPDYADEKIGYAGRLDPMARGVMLLLVGVENFNREKYLRLDKEYEFTVLFGVSTDTYDILGLLKDGAPNIAIDNLETRINDLIPKYVGKKIQPYPPYSTKTVNGIPLFKWSRRNLLHTIKIPTKEIEIYSLKLNTTSTIKASVLQKEIITKINKIKGDFRQEEILQKWYEFFKIHPDINYQTANFTLSCTSGTYVRSIANSMGEKLGTGAIALDILRTRVGEYKLEDAIRI